MVWDERTAGNAFTGEIAWDGRWSDKSQAQPGEYLAWVKAVDTAGNESEAGQEERVDTGPPVVEMPVR